MADLEKLEKLAAYAAEVAQRVADVLDAARGKGARVGAGSSAARLLVLPALNSRGFPPGARGEFEQSHSHHGGEIGRNGDLYAHLLDRAERRQRRRQVTG